MMETPPLKQRKQIICKSLPFSMAALRQLLRKTLPPVSSLLNTWSTSMELIAILVKNKFYELRLEINEEEQWIVVSRFLLTNLFDATMIVL